MYVKRPERGYFLPWLVRKPPLGPSQPQVRLTLSPFQTAEEIELARLVNLKSSWEGLVRAQNSVFRYLNISERNILILGEKYSWSYDNSESFPM